MLVSVPVIIVLVRVAVAMVSVTVVKVSVRLVVPVVFVEVEVLIVSVVVVVNGEVTIVEIGGHEEAGALDEQKGPAQEHWKEGERSCRDSSSMQHSTLQPWWQSR